LRGRAAIPTLDEVRDALRLAWSRATSADPDGWSQHNPALGQCAVSALIVQDFFGGDLLRADVGGAGHYWNRLPDGSSIDLTIEQFGEVAKIGIEEERPRSYVMSFASTQRRYELLMDRVRQGLGVLGGMT
jgi:hypothetical protein